MAKYFQENGMVIVVININGQMKWAECADRGEAEKEADKWLKEAKQSFPNGEFKPHYFNGVKLEN